MYRCKCCMDFLEQLTTEETLWRNFLAAGPSVDSGKSCLSLAGSKAILFVHNAIDHHVGKDGMVRKQRS